MEIELKGGGMNISISATITTMLLVGIARTSLKHFFGVNIPDSVWNSAAFTAGAITGLSF